MKHLTAGEASRLAGVSKATICRALKTGKLSYVSIDSDGYKIDPAELSRVYNLKHHETPKGVAMKRYETPNETPPNDHEKELLKLKIQHLEEKLKMVEKENEYLRHDKEQWQKQAARNLLSAPKIDPLTVQKIQKETVKKYKEWLDKRGR